MKQLNLKLLRVFYIFVLASLLALPALAADLTGTMTVEPTREIEAQAWNADLDPAAGMVNNELLAAGGYVDHTIGSYGLAIIKKFEGFAETAYYDYSQYSIGYGSNYNYAVKMFPEIAKTGKITEAQATEVLKSMINHPKDSEYPSGGFAVWLNGALRDSGIAVNQNQFDALVSFTYNVGSGWWTYRNDDGSWCMLRQMLEDSPANWTENRAQKSFGSWVNAGGVRLEGLVARRKEEATLFCTPVKGTETTAENTSTGPFLDVTPGSWYYSNISTAYDRGLMSGYGNGYFGPEDQVTRAQMVTALAKLVGTEATSFSGSLSSFSDVPAGKWYSRPIGWAYSNGIVNGTGNGRFDPDAEITRQDLCCILARYLKSEGVSGGANPAPFADDGQFSGYARESIYYCASLGLIKGVGDGSFEPKDVASRAQLATILVRMDDLLG